MTHQTRGLNAQVNEHSLHGYPFTDTVSKVERGIWVCRPSISPTDARSAGNPRFSGLSSEVAAPAAFCVAQLGDVASLASSHLWSRIGFQERSRESAIVHCRSIAFVVFALVVGGAEPRPQSPTIECQSMPRRWISRNGSRTDRTNVLTTKMTAGSNPPVDSVRGTGSTRGRLRDAGASHLVRREGSVTYQGRHRAIRPP